MTTGLFSVSGTPDIAAWPDGEREVSYNNREAFVTRFRRLSETLTGTSNGDKQLGTRLVKSPPFLGMTCPLSMFPWIWKFFIVNQGSSWKGSLADGIKAWGRLSPFTSKSVVFLTDRPVDVELWSPF
jgi:hypothetical protein